MELVDLVNSVIIFLSQTKKQDIPFHRVPYDYSRADWDGLRDHLKDVHGRITLNSVHLLLLVNIVSGFRL